MTRLGLKVIRRYNHAGKQRDLGERGVQGRGLGSNGGGGGGGGCREGG